MDFYLFQQINSLAGRFLWLDNLSIFLASWLGYVLVAALILLFWKKKIVIILAILAAIFARLGIVELVRALCFRPRPFIENHVNMLVDYSNKASFPSGHAAFFFGLSAVVFLYNKKIGALFFALSFLIVIARVFVGIHWPLDILAGAGVGIFSGWAVVKVFKKLKTIK